MKPLWVAVAATAMCAAASAAVAQETGDGGSQPSVRVGRALRVAFVGRVQLDVRRPEPGTRREDAAAFDVAQKRVGLKGRLTQATSFQVEAELDRRDPWRDVYAAYRASRALAVRAGRFKAPFSLDENTGSARLDFTRRSHAATRLAPGRDLGLMLAGRLWHKRLTYEAGAFHRDRTAAVRVAVSPFAGRTAPAGRVHAALAFTRGRLEERLVRSYWLEGARSRMGLEMRWEPGPVAITAEYMRTNDERHGQSPAGEDLPALIADGWYLSAKWRLRAGRAPARPGIDLVARVEGLRAARGGADANPRAESPHRPHDRALTLGVNAYPSRWVKLQADVTRERDATGGAPGWRPSIRIQVGI